MKLILERWDNFLNEAFEACDTPFKVGDLKLATDIVKYLNDQEAANKRLEQLAKSPFERFLDNAKKLAVPIAKMGFWAGTAATGAGGAAIGAVSAAVMAHDAGELLGQVFMLGSREEENESIKEFLLTFCVDQETLDLIEDKFQAKYIKESDVVAELKNYFETANDDAPLPDITAHLVEWLNNESDYNQSDDTYMVAKD
tara:strand:+ start:1015 stop:1611 length:597 start_codon:yes stop_codon:yes gene_type:complete